MSEREAFEAYAFECGWRNFTRIDDGYAAPGVQKDWLIFSSGWQARASAAIPREPQMQRLSPEVEQIVQDHRAELYDAAPPAQEPGALEALREAMQELMDVHALSLQGAASTLGGDKFALRHRKAWEAARAALAQASTPAVAQEPGALTDAECDVLIDTEYDKNAKTWREEARALVRVGYGAALGRIEALERSIKQLAYISDGGTQARILHKQAEARAERAESALADALKVQKP